MGDRMKGSASWNFVVAALGVACCIAALTESDAEVAYKVAPLDAHKQ